MFAGEATGAERALGINRKQCIAGIVHNIQEFSFERFCSWQFPQAYFGCDLPRRCRGYENYVDPIRDDRRCLTAQRRW